MFNVPGVIGVNAKDGSSPEFSSYEEFITAMTRRHKDQDTYQKEIDESIETMWKKCDELGKLIKKRVTDSELEKTEKELRLKIDEKIVEVNEAMKRDKIDNTAKLAVVKSEFAQKTFDTDTFNFLKNQVRYEWPPQMAKLNETDRKLTELLEKHEEVSNLVNRTINKLKSGAALEEAESELDDVIQEPDEVLQPLRESKSSSIGRDPTKSPSSQPATLEVAEDQPTSKQASTI